ncbi:MAG: hypothetical protein PHU63_03925 [Candidatus ainarchaeum sp.]|nr:hypothetical protein [Candidatus ainarchaeum sp.]
MDYYSKLLSLMDKDELEKEISDKINEFHGYISREAAITLIAKNKKLYLPEVKFSAISDLKENSGNINIIGKIISISETNFYSSGKKSKSIIIEKEGQQVSLILWEKDIALANKIRLNDEVELRNVFYKNGRLTLGYKGSLSVYKKKGFQSINSLNSEGPFNVKGFISLSRDSSNAPLFSLSDSEGTILIVKTEHDSRFNSLMDKDELILENVHFKDGKLFVDKNSRILHRRPDNFLIGKINSINLKDNALEINLENKSITLEGEDIFLFFNLKPTSLSLETLLALKRDSYLGKKVLIKFKKINNIHKFESMSFI